MLRKLAELWSFCLHAKCYCWKLIGMVHVHVHSHQIKQSGGANKVSHLQKCMRKKGNKSRLLKRTVDLLFLFLMALANHINLVKF